MVSVDNMRFRDIPERLLGSQTGVKVLRVLVRHPGAEMTGREVARLAGAPHPRVLERLAALEAEGLVARRFAGRAHLWRLEASHVLVGPLRELFGVDRHVQQELQRSIQRSLSRVPGVVEAVLFGSVARGDEEPLSDVDLFVLVKDRKSKQAAKRELETLRTHIRDRFGNWLQPMVYTQGEVRRRPRMAFLGPARKEGILLAGKAPAGSRRPGRAPRGA
jgi:predicted nucleotidyltransferase